MPAEWEPHRGTWLSWPHKEASWPGKFEPVPAIFAAIVRHLADREEVHINVAGPAMEAVGRGALLADARRRRRQRLLPPQSHQRRLVPRPRADLRAAREDGRREQAIVDWGYNAWGGKYPPYDLDDVIPDPDRRGARPAGLPSRASCMEGGSIDVNGRGTLLTTEACLLNPNRNPAARPRPTSSGYLRDYLGVTKILWLGDGIVGDDTDGHVDDLTRFVDPTHGRHGGRGRSGRRKLRAAPGQPGAAPRDDRPGRPAASRS